MHVCRKIRNNIFDYMGGINNDCQDLVLPLN